MAYPSQEPQINATQRWRDQVHVRTLHIALCSVQVAPMQLDATLSRAKGGAADMLPPEGVRLTGCLRGKGTYKAIVRRC